jgi:hypothetical protein
MQETLMDDIEQHKENILPLQQGRSAAALAQALSASNKPTSSNSNDPLKSQELEFEQLIQNASDDDDDPLDPYFRYVQWIQTNFPSGKTTQLMKIVEKSVRRFKGDPRYRNDPRFLKLWLLVAHQAKEPIEVFKYLSVNKIGVDLALYYEEYSKLLEKISRYVSRADVYVSP